MTFIFNENNLERVKLAIAKYPQGRQKSAVMELLHIAQEQYGYVSDHVVLEVAKILDIPVTKVREISTFYSMYNQKKVGKYLIQFCGTTPCMLRGAEEILQAILTKLNVSIGQTTKDELFTVIEVECLGACSNAPMMQINNFYYEDLTIENTFSILDKLAKGDDVCVGSQIGRKSAEPL